MSRPHREPWLSPFELGDNDGRAAAAVDFGLPVTLSGNDLLARAWHEAQTAVSSYGVAQYMGAFQAAYAAGLGRLNEAMLVPVTLGGEMYRRRGGAWERVA